MTITAGYPQGLSGHDRYLGASANDNDVVFTTGDVGRYDGFMIMSVTGAVDVYPSLDGTNFSTTPISLQDFGALDNTPVNETVAARVYGFVGKFAAVRVLQKGATAVTFCALNCWKL